jgi:hypothetical protein
LGQSLEIPIIIRSLAGSISLEDEEILPFDTDPSLLHTLDAGEHQLVTSFELQWWSGRNPRDINTVQIFNALTLTKCMDHYRRQKKKAFEIPTGAGAGAVPSFNAGPGKSSNAGPSFDAGAGKSSNAGASKNTDSGPAFNAGSSSSTGTGTGCGGCNKYRQLLSDVLQDVLKFQNYASVMTTSSENLFINGIRRASTFNVLHEAAILKETASVSPPVKAKGKPAHHISAVMRNASSELARLKDLPASSYKWTWGEKLTEEEVLDLRRIGTRPGRVQHSGYDISLQEGRMGGEDSAGPTSNLSFTGYYDDLPAEATVVVPPTDLHFPEYFSTPDNRLIYNPFRITAPAQAPVVSSAPVISSAPDAGILSESSSNAGFGPDNADIAENWTSGSDDAASIENEQGPVSMPLVHDDTDDNFKLADNWEDDDDSSPEPAPEHVPVLQDDTDDNLKLADNWEDDEGLSPEPVASPSDQDPEGILAFTDNWVEDEEHSGDEVDEEHSGDELTTPSYADEEAAEYSAILRNVEWTFGPEDFGFLSDDMFE